MCTDLVDSSVFEINIAWIVMTILLIIFDNGVGDTDKIWGGRRAKPGEFPFAVLIKGNLYCGGGLLTMDKIVTAGHCFMYWKTNGEKIELDLKISVVIGGTVSYLQPYSGYQKKKISAYKLHKNYSKRKDGSFFHDIAIANLTQPFRKSLMLKTMPIPKGDKTKFKYLWDRLVALGRKCYAMGWGTNGTGFSKPTENLMVIEVKVWSEERCRETAWNTEDLVTRFGEVCAASEIEGETFCDGDSGSPLYCDGHVYALATANWQCGNTSLPQYFLLFWKYLDMLRSNLRSHAECPHLGICYITIPVISLKNYFGL